MFLENNTVEKLEYKNRIDEMKDLISQNKFADAMSVAESVNWRKVHNINDLIAGSECYEAAGKIEEARELLFLAHERSPIGRMIIYKLCMISIKLKDIEMAQEYYNEFVQIAPHDSLKYILKYNISIAKGADNATLIKILEQLKESDFIEEWAYELAYLYHKTNQAEKCIGLCDEIILWFGDGPVVERALELKMLYQPLDKAQEDKYRSFQQKKDGLAEIHPYSNINPSEVLPHMPAIELPEGPERFDTINLQAEIKKNIDEIMKATDTGEVSENIGAIKNLVEEIPYLQVKEELEDSLEEEEFSINDTFNEYLKEGNDGQISLLLPDEADDEETQVEGQMTIEDVLAEWEKTKRAAEAAMEDAKSKELENARARALREANNVLNRLEGVMSKLDAGMTSAELLKEEYLSEQVDTTDSDTNVSEDSTEVEELPEEITDDIPEDESEEKLQDIREIKPWPILDEANELDDFQNTEDSEESEPKSFTIPKLNIEGLEEGSLDIPVINPAGAAAIPGAVSAVADPVLHAAEALDKANWQPPTLDTEETDEVDLKEASQMIADVNDFLQKEIDRLTLGSEQVSAQVPEPVEEDIVLPEIKLPEIKMPEEIEEEFDEPLTEAYDEPEEPLTNEVELDIVSQEDQDLFEEEDVEIEEEAIPEDIVPDINISDIELPPIELPQDILEDTGVEPIQSEPVFAPEPIPLPQSVMADPLPEVTQVTLDEPIAPAAPVASPVQAVDQANTAASAVDFELEDEDLAIFSYFLPITGMKKSIAQAITGTAAHLAQAGSKGGSIAIIGEPGSGKTQMATSIIKVLEKKTGYPKGGIGKISGEKLNEKDIQKLYSKIQGGCLIIEAAGGISKETAVTLSLLMEQDNSGTIIIIEDNKKGIEKALLRDGSFAKRFTQKVVIPVFSIDELVSFAKTYAMEAGCTIDDMGVLALYNRINLIGRYDHATTIKEVAEIMDEAIDKSTRGGFFNKPKYDKNGNIILKEKDFDR